MQRALTKAGYEEATPVQAGVIIIATGAEELKPVGTYGYGSDPRVITQQETMPRAAPASVPATPTNIP